MPATTANRAEPVTRTEPSARPKRGTGELVKQGTQQLSELVRAEIRLAFAEIKDKGRHAGMGAGLFGGAGLVAAYGIGALVIAAIAALALVVAVWAAALIIGAVLLVIAAICALTGRRQVTRAVPPVPEQAVRSAKQDVIYLKDRAVR